MQAATDSGPDWRDRAAYAPLLGADRSFFAWEWLRRDPRYRAAAARAFAGRFPRGEDASAAPFGLVAFESPDLAVPQARPFWRAETHPAVLAAERGSKAGPADVLATERLAAIATLLIGRTREHLLLSDGLRAIRLDGPLRTFSQGPVTLRYRLEGLASAESSLLTLRRLLNLCRNCGFARSLHRPESRARRWILMLRAWDALNRGADQRAIAEVLLSRSAAEPLWRTREPSVRSQAQRLVRSASRMASGQFRELLL